MKSSLEKLQKIFKHEAGLGYENRAVIGGLERYIELWERDARLDGLPENLIQFVKSRTIGYSRLTPKSRAEVLEGLGRRIQRDQDFTSSQDESEVEETREVDQIELGQERSRSREIEEVAESGQKSADQNDEIQIDQAVEAYSRTRNENIQSSLPPARPMAQPPSMPGNFEPAALDAPVKVLPGVGISHSKTLSRLGLYTLRDMLYYFPRRYDDYSNLKPINRLWYGEEVTVIGTFQHLAVRPLRGGQMQLVEAAVGDGSGTLRVTWFNQVWITKKYHPGDQVVLSGKIDQYLGRLVMNSPELEPLDQQQLNTNRIVPVYPLSASITQRWLRRLMNQVVTYWAPRVRDSMPKNLLQSADLLSMSEALLQIHFPESQEALAAARHRLAFDEIFLLQLGVLRQKHTWQNRTASVYQADDDQLNTLISGLPYALTTAQLRAVEDIRHDLASGKPMNRLLQGDVGSGKTIVAALAVAMIAQHNAQAAIMAPTSILAEQHYQNLINILATDNPDAGVDHEDLRVMPLQRSEISILLGSTPEREKRETKAGLADGTIKLVIGTHALIEEPVNFSNLQLLVVDEQHRFGVEQRAALRSKGENPHLLVMTATPIPRSLALTVYGDLDLSVMDEMPPGRQQVATYVLSPRERERAYTLIRNQVSQGHQAFIIYPLVEETDSSDSKAAVEEHAHLAREVFPKYNLGLLHGRLRPEEKDEVMMHYRDGESQILVSTSVVEVGVDVPNATVMLIEGANRFGLAQLHQFRGRVGRGKEQSYCLLIPETEDAVENERLQVMAETNDGFVLAERDLEQRGPGEFLGTRQSGYSELKLANLTDVHLIEKARRHAQTLFENDPELDQAEHQPLLKALRQFWSGGKGDVS